MEHGALGAFRTCLEMRGGKGQLAIILPYPLLNAVVVNLR
jgi:hypothetical protein